MTTTAPTTTYRLRGTARRLALLGGGFASVLALCLGGAAVPSAQAAPSDPGSSPSVAPAAVRQPGWSVRATGADRWQISWTSTSRFPVVSDRPTIVGRDGAPLGTPTVSRDGRTVQVDVSASTKPDTTRLGVVLSGSRLDRPGRETSPTRRSAATRTLDQRVDDQAQPGRRLATDPGVAGQYPVVSSDYTLPSVRVPGLTQPIEMVGHVVEPTAAAATGPRPLVLFLHGRHEACYQVRKGDYDDAWPCRGTMAEVPSQLGYDYAQRLLASQGYATVSVRVNGINAQDWVLPDGGADARARIVIAHLDHWASIATAHQVDLSRVVLVGHSRGGEGVDRAALRIPLTAPYRVVGQVLLAPTDFGYQTAPYVPTVTVLPYCDGDVSDLQGQRFTDTSRDLNADDTSLKSSVLVMGANHNFFNTQWTPGLATAPANDDWYGDPTQECGTKTATRLTATQQQKVGKAYVAAAVHQFTDTTTAQPYLPLFDGSDVSLASTAPAVVHSHAIGGGRDLRRPGTDATLTLAVGATSQFCGGAVSDDYRPDLCGSELSDLTAPHWSFREDAVPTRSFWQVGWTARGQTAGLQLRRALDLRSRTLDLRAIVDPRRGDVALRVRLTDDTGRTATLTPVGGSTVRALPSANDVTKLWAQTVRIDPTAAAGAIDVARVTEVELVGDSTDGRLWVADLSAAPRTAPAVPVERAPALSFGDREVREGNRSGTTTTELPFTLSAPMAGPGQAKVVIRGGSLRATQNLTIDLAPGQDHGSIPVGYVADTLDSYAKTPVYALAYATRGITTDAYAGTLTVDDDDPTPKVTISRARTHVAEGRTATWKVTLAKPVGYDTFVEGFVTNGPGRDLVGADVPARWLAEHGNTSRTKTLAANHVVVFADLPAGRTSATLTIPTRRDGKKEGTEAVTLKVTALSTTRTSTIRIDPSK